jgi:hypothetical protein
MRSRGRRVLPHHCGQWGLCQLDSRRHTATAAAPSAAACLQPCFRFTRTGHATGAARAQWVSTDEHTTCVTACLQHSAPPPAPHSALSPVPAHSSHSSHSTCGGGAEVCACVCTSSSTGRARHGQLRATSLEQPSLDAGWQCARACTRCPAVCAERPRQPASQSNRHTAGHCRCRSAHGTRQEHAAPLRRAWMRAAAPMRGGAEGRTRGWLHCSSDRQPTGQQKRMHAPTARDTRSHSTHVPAQLSSAHVTQGAGMQAQIAGAPSRTASRKGLGTRC